MSFHPETESYKYWTQEEDSQLEKLVSTGKYDFKSIGKSLNRSGSSCQCRSKVLGFSNNYRWHLYEHNETFFKTPNLLNCYWAGFLAADGSLDEYGGGASLRLEIADLDHLEKFKIDVGFNGKTLGCNRFDRILRTKRVIINSRYWIHDLRENFGIIPNKVRRLVPPKLDNDLLNLVFIIGYIDGDGCICIFNRLNKLSTSLSIVSCSFPLLEYIKRYLDKYFISYRLRNKTNMIRRHSNCNDAGVLYYSGAMSLAIVDFLKDFPIPKLQRKWQNPKVLEFLEQKKLEYPDFFKLTPELQSIQSQLLAYNPANEVTTPILDNIS